MHHRMTFKSRLQRKTENHPTTKPASEHSAAGIPRFMGRDHRTIARSGRQGLPTESIPLTNKSARVYDNAASHRAAYQLGAYAYSWRGDIFLGAGLTGTARSAVIQHELTHARQAHNRGPAASPIALEQEALTSRDGSARLAADPDAVQGLWWIIPLAAGLYVLLRPNVANAPTSAATPTYPSVSGLQVGAEALALFAVPAGISGALARAGYGVIAAGALSGAGSAVAFRGVQDVGAGQFSGVQAYVIDATTGAVIGAVIGGVFRPFNASRPIPGQGNPALVHLTDEAGQAGINASQTLRGSQGIYAVPQTVAAESSAMRSARTLLRPAQTSQSVAVPQNASRMFSQPSAVGPVSAYQRMMGVYRAPAGQINMLTGEFTASANPLANITGQFWPYGADMLIWAGAGLVGSQLSPSTPQAAERGVFSSTPLYDFMRMQPPPPVSTRSDGPFIFVDPMALLPENDLNTLAGQPSPLASTMPSVPALIFVEPIVSMPPR
ncbi:MAG: DUF4157 domain-containing protein [Anaerolineae bacterium]|nr:DUF4157 domain-containing protein [Anaerolineae bacterium]